MKPIDVLIVEDELLLSDILADIFRQHQRYNVVGCVDRIELAKKYLLSYHPKLIILDNMLPDGRGIDFIRHCVKERYKGEIIVITADNHMDTISDAIRLGAFDYLIKPVNHQRLMQTLNRYLLYKGTMHSNDHCNQSHIDTLFNMQGKAQELADDESEQGINKEKIKQLYELFPEASVKHTVETVAVELGSSKPTARRYLEYSVRTGFLTADVLFGKRGRPERIYRLKTIDN